MVPLVRTAARAWTRHALPSSPPSAAALAFQKPTIAAVQQQTRGRADEASTYQSSSFDSPFHRSGGTARSTYDIPDFGHYKSNNNELTNKGLSIFYGGNFWRFDSNGCKGNCARYALAYSSLGIGESAMRANRDPMADFLVNMSASADVLAQAKVEIDLTQIPLGKNV